MNTEQTSYDQDTLPDSMTYSPVTGLLASFNETDGNTHTSPNSNSEQENHITEPDQYTYTGTSTGILDESGKFVPKWWEQHPDLAETGKTLKKFKSPEALAKSYAELEKLRSYPDPSDEERMGRFRSLLGLPEKADEYKLNRPELMDGMESCWDNELADKIAVTAYRYAIPHVALQAVTDAFMEEQTRHFANYQADENRRYAHQKEDFLSELKEEWGPQCQSRLKSAANTLEQLCAEANINPSALSGDPIIGSHPDFIKLLDHIGKTMNDSPLKGAEKSTSTSTMDEARRMENDPSHPLHEAYMDYNHPNHEYANKLYDQAFLNK